MPFANYSYCYAGDGIYYIICINPNWNEDYSKLLMFYRYNIITKEVNSIPWDTSVSTTPSSPGNFGSSTEITMAYYNNTINVLFESGFYGGLQQFSISEGKIQVKSVYYLDNICPTSFIAQEGSQADSSSQRDVSRDRILFIDNGKLCISRSHIVYEYTDSRYPAFSYYYAGYAVYLVDIDNPSETTMIINEYKTGMGTCTIGSATDGIAFVDSETNSKYIFTYSYANAKVYKIENNTANLYWDCGNAIIETYRHYNFARYKNGIIGISTYDNIISGESSTDIDVIQIDIINSVYTYNRNIQTSMASQLYNVYDYSYIYNNNPSGHCNAFGGVNALYYDKWIYFYNDNRYYRVSIDGQFEVCNSDIHGSVVKSRYTDPYNLNIFFTSKADTESGFIIIFNGDEGINIIAPDIQVQNTNTFIKVKE